MGRALGSWRGAATQQGWSSLHLLWVLFSFIMQLILKIQETKQKYIDQAVSAEA